MHQLPADIVTIDTLHLGRSGTIACYLIRGSVPILVDPGPAVCLPALTAALATVGLTLADIGAVLAAANVDVNAPSTSPGCMSFPGDADCPPVMGALGLAYGTAAAPGSQRLFTVR